MTQSVYENGSMDSNTQHLISAITGHSNTLGANKTNPVHCSVRTRVKAGQAYQAKGRQAAGRMKRKNEGTEDRRHPDLGSRMLQCCAAEITLLERLG